MNAPDEAFLRMLREAFKTEAEEHLHAISSGLQDLEKAPEKDRAGAIIETIYREAHSLKGAARAVNRPDIEALCQDAESVFARWKRAESAPTRGAISVLLRAADAASGSIAAGAQVEPAALAQLIHEIGTVATAPAAKAPPPDEPPPVVIPVAAEKNVSPETVRIPIAKLDEIITRVEEFLPAKLAAEERATELHELETIIDEWHEEWSGIHPRIRDIQSAADRNAAPSPPDLVRLLEFMNWSQRSLHRLDEKLSTLSRSATHDRQEIDKRVNDMLESTKKLAMVPSHTILLALPRIVRDICRDSGKEAELAITGGDVEVDKNILEELRDPLVHIVRNCVDHGIEQPGVRVRRGKPERGRISVAVSQLEGNKVEFVIADDGDGIDLRMLKQAAVTNSILSAADAARLPDEQAFRLIFESGISTSRAVTEISGRGLGLAIAREKTEKLGGGIFVESHRETGTTFRLVLPLTRGTFRGILVQAAGQIFVIPTETMERAGRVNRNDIRTVENRETLSIDGRPTALVQLAEVLGIERRNSPRKETLCVAILRTGDKRIAFGIEQVLHETEVLVKPLGPPLVRVRNVAAATVFGGGQVVLILNVADLMKTAAQMTRSAPAKTRPETSGATTKKASLLVVEDSITARMLLKNILEAAGHRVRTAVDGVDALTALHTEDFDLIVSDVEMPRMNGLDLTARIRADKRTAEKPVILVTALATSEDRERGIQVGANAYIVKSNFDQSNLLAAIDRLL